VATLKVAIRLRVPWRMYSCSRRSGQPGRSGFVGAARSSAWMPVISSVLATWQPSASNIGASA